MLRQDGDVRQIEIVGPQIVEGLARPGEPGEASQRGGAVPAEQQDCRPHSLGQSPSGDGSYKSAADARGSGPAGDHQDILGGIGVGGRSLETTEKRGHGIAEEGREKAAIRLEDELGDDAALRRQRTANRSFLHPVSPLEAIRYRNRPSPPRMTPFDSIDPRK